MWNAWTVPGQHEGFYTYSCHTDIEENKKMGKYPREGSKGERMRLCVCEGEGFSLILLI